MKLAKPVARKPVRRSVKVTLPEGQTAPSPAAGEHVRVVPLHYPKPSIQIDELRRRRLAEEEGGSDLFSDEPRVAPASAHLTYFNGPLLTNVKVYVIYWGKLWGTTAASTNLIHKIESFFKAILVSPLMDQ